MKKIIAIIFLGLLLGCSCNKEENPPTIIENNILIEKPFLWWNKEEEHDQSIETTPLIYNGSFIGESHQNGKSYLSLIFSKNGELIWKWNDYTKQIDLTLGYVFNYSNQLIFQSGPRSYCIDMNTGKTQWKIDRGISYTSFISGYKNEVFLCQQEAESGSLYPSIIICNILDGQIVKKIRPNFRNTTIKNVLDEYGYIEGVKKFEKDNKEYLLITYTEANSLSQSNAFLGLYNITDNIWIYDRKPLHTRKILSCPVIHNNKIYHYKDNLIICNELMTGDSIWTQKFTGTFGFGEFLINQGTLYCAAEGDGYYALDAETGAIKWKGERAPGTSSRMVILNDVLYYINGGDGRLWALDASNGKTLWRLKSPDGNSFKREINVMQGDEKRKGYILTSTWHGACAYEAER